MTRRSRIVNELTPRELDVLAAWWHVGSVKGAAELLNLSEQMAKGTLWMARTRTGAPNNLTMARLYAAKLPSLAVVRRHARKAA